MNNEGMVSAASSGDISGQKPERITASGHDAPEGTRDARLRRACADFEGILLNYMFETMQRSVDSGGGVFKASHQKRMYESMFTLEMSTQLARNNGIGLGQALYRQVAGQAYGDSSGNGAPAVRTAQDAPRADRYEKNTNR